MIIRVRDNIFKRAGPCPLGLPPWALPVGPGPRAWQMLSRTLIIIFLRLQGSMLTKCLQLYLFYLLLLYISYWLEFVNHFCYHYLFPQHLCYGSSFLPSLNVSWSHCWKRPFPTPSGHQGTVIVVVVVMLYRLSSDICIIRNL